MPLVAVIGPFALGWAIARTILPQGKLFEKIGISWPLGLGVLTFLMFLAGLAGVRIDLFSSLIILSVAIILFIFTDRINNNFPDFRLIIRRLSVSEKLLILVLIGIFIGILVWDAYWPVRGWDAIVLYDLRAKIITDTGGFSQITSWSYPLNTSLAHTWFYLTGWNTPMPIYALYYGSFILSFGSLLSYRISRLQSIVFSLFLAASPQLFYHADMAYTNLPFVEYMILGSIYLYLWITQKSRGFLVISLILTALAVWTRYREPFWLANIAVISVYYFFSHRKAYGS